MFQYAPINLNESESESEPEDIEFEIEKVLNNIDLNEYMNIDEKIVFPDLNPNSILGDQNEIYQMLKGSIVQNNFLIDNVERQILEMDFKIDYYRNFIFSDDKRMSKLKENKFLLDKSSDEDVLAIEAINEQNQDTFYLTAPEIEEKMKKNELTVPSASKGGKSLVQNPLMKKTIEDLAYMGFDENELTDFPGFIEAPQLLNNLSSKMGFKASFLKYWTQIIRSDASCAIILDSFWWFYLKYFKKDPALDDDAYKYFCRISESFAALLFTIDTTMRDRFFGLYADFLSQAIYLAFYYVFPDSRLHFNDNFKQEICNTVYEWVMGIRPVPECYMNWKINDDISMTGSGDKKISSTSEILSKISNLEKLLNSLGEREREPLVKFEDKSRHSARQNKSSLDFSKTVDLFYHKKSNESHVLGEGAQIEKISFNLKGKSVLINHYIKIHHLDPKDNSGHKISRSEIVKQPPRTAPTYRDFIYNTLERAKTMGDDLTRKSQEHENEMKKIEKQRKKAVNDFLKLKRSASSSTLNSSGSKKSSTIKRSNSSDTNRIELIETDEENI